MKLHSLTMQGLGPFQDQQQIDFTDVAKSGLFLLEGPTGAGKSTVIDAIVFALYGGLASAAADTGRLVSDYLRPGEEPFVELVFETTGGIYRVRRSPSYTRPSKRGGGTTKANSTVSLVRLGSPDSVHGEEVSTNIGAADAEIQRVIGLSKNQFIGTVILPQGEFATFLRADVEARERILRRIFRTDMYKRIQERLWDLKKEAEAQRADAGSAVRVRVGTFCGAAGLGSQLPGWDGEVGQSDQLTEALSRALLNLQTAESELLEAKTMATARTVEAREQVRVLSHRAAQRDRLRGALTRQAELLAAAGEHEGRRQRVTQAHAASRVGDALDAEAKASASVEEARRGLAQAESAAPATAQGLDEPDLLELRDDLNATAAKIAELVVVESGLEERAARHEEIRTEILRMRGSQQALQGVLAECGERIEELRARREEAVLLAANSDELQRALANIQTSMQAWTDLKAKRTELEESGRIRLETVKATQSAWDEVSTLRRLHYAGMAAELAVNLEDDQPCPVCGSPVHPQPAVPSEGHVTRAMIDEAESRWKDCEADQELASTRFDDIRRAFDVLSGGLDGLDGDRLADQLAQTEGRLGKAARAADRVVQLSGEIAELEAMVASHRDSITQLAADSAAADANLATQTHILTEDRRRVSEARLGHPTVEQRLRETTRQAEAIDRLLEALHAARTASANHRGAAGALAAALAREGFADAGQAASARMSPSELASLEDQVQAYDRERHDVETTITDPSLAGLDPEEPIDLEAANTQLAEAEGTLDVVTASHAGAERRHRDATAAAAGVTEAIADRRRIMEGTSSLIQLAKLTAGYGGGLAMELSTFVLHQRFEAVVAAANGHLRVMSDGVFTLEIHGDVERSKRRGGLGLRVIDLRTDSTRPTGTLSGGETFYTALSLALGLADVVVGEAGGVDMGTLFVDEGFGSLDSETLDDVMSVLTGLRVGGRTVGVISHVDEMKHRIGERISVRRDGVGGPSRITVCA